jgi:hypothetical protein
MNRECLSAEEVSAEAVVDPWRDEETIMIEATHVDMQAVVAGTRGSTTFPPLFKEVRSRHGPFRMIAWIELKSVSKQKAVRSMLTLSSGKDLITARRRSVSTLRTVVFARSTA